MTAWNKRLKLHAYIPQEAVSMEYASVGNVVMVDGAAGGHMVVSKPKYSDSLDVEDANEDDWAAADKTPLQVSLPA
jgi:hypothetical protein